jgi:O-antigen/teichoic acid export membrane protein
MNEQVVSLGSRGRTAVLAASWTTFAFVFAQLLRLASNVILARLLSPELFGLSALAMTVIVGMSKLSDIGLTPSLVRSSRGEDRNFRNTVWTLGILRGLLLWLVSALVALPLGCFFDQRLTSLLPVLGSAALLAALGSSSMAVFGRNMQLGYVTLLEICSTLVSVLATVAIAWWWTSVWALVIGYLIGSAARSAGSWLLNIKHRDRLQIDASVIEEILPFSKWILLSTSLTFLAFQFDKLILAKLESLADVGLYTIALTFVSLPRELTGRLSDAVQFPLLARSQRDGNGFETTFAKSRDALLWLSLWGTATVSLGSQAFFAVLYDGRYAPAVFLTHVLGFVVFLWTLSETADKALLAIGDSRMLAMTNLVQGLAMVFGSFIGGMCFGMLGFVGGIAFSALVNHGVKVYGLRKHGIRIVAHDLFWVIGFLLVLLTPLLGSRWIQLGQVGGADIAQVLLALAELTPLSVVIISRVNAILNLRSCLTSVG